MMRESKRSWSTTSVWGLALLAMLAALLPLTAGASTDAAAAPRTQSFTDVPPTHQFFTEIEWLAAEGIAGGYGTGEFRPTLWIARQAMAAWLYRFEGEPAFTPPSTPTYSDIPTSHTFFAEIEWAADRGIMGGYADGTFKATRTISRQAMAALLYRLAGEPTFAAPATATFTDVPTTHTFATEIEWASANGVVGGYATGQFKPASAVTRQAAAAFLYRYDQLVRPDRWTAPRQISNAEVSSLLSDPVTVATDDGAVHVAWKEDDELLYRKLDAAGNTLVRTVHLGVDPVQARALAWSDIVLTPLDDGGVALLWRYSVGTPQKPGIYGLRIDAQGRLATSPRLLGAGFFSHLSAATDDSGAIHLVAVSVNSSTTVVSATTASHRIVAIRLTPDLRPAGSWMVITDRIGNNATNYPKLAVEGDGTTHLAWFDSRRFGSYSNTYDIYYTRWDGPGPYIAPMQLSDKPTGYVVTPDLHGFGVGPAVDIAADGTALVAWLNYDDVHLASVAPDGTPVLRDVTSNLGQPTAKRNDGLVVHAEDDGDATIIVPSGSDTFPTPVQVRFAADGTLVAAPVEIPVGSGGWTFPSLTTAGTERQLVLRKGSTSHLLYVTTTAIDAPTNRADLMVDAAHITTTSTHTPARANDAVHLEVQAANTGFVASPAALIVITYNGAIVDEVPVPALEVDEVATLTADWTVPADIALDMALLTVAIDPTLTITETTEANNSVVLEVPIVLGPVDDEGVVRPAGARVTVYAQDETTDEARASLVGVQGATATLTGTTTEGDPFTTTATASPYYHLVWFADLVPPGSYELTGSAPGYVLSEPVAMTVTRDAIDGDVFTVSPPNSASLWFNRWATITGTVTAGATPLAGATVVEAGQGFTTTTDANGEFTLSHVAAGDHTITVAADGYVRQRDIPVTVTAAGSTDVPVAMVVSTVGYVDVTATNAYDAVLPGTTIELLNASNAVVATCSADADGRCSFEPTAGSGYKVRASRGGYITATSTPFAVVVGGLYPKQLALEIVIGDVTVTSTGDKGWFVGAEYFCGGVDVPYYGCTGSEFYNLYGFFGNTIDIEHQVVGTETVIRSLSTTVTGAPLEFTIFTASLDFGGAFELPVVIPDASAEYTNARIDAIRIRDRETGVVVWQQTPTIYSHADVGSAAWLPDATVSSWSNVAIEVDIKLGRVVFGSTGGDGFTPSPILNYWGSSRRITWTPANGQIRNDAIFP